MLRFVCDSCGQVWYSASSLDKPCEKCGGHVSEAEPPRDEAAS